MFTVIKVKAIISKFKNNTKKREEYGEKDNRDWIRMKKYF